MELRLKIGFLFQRSALYDIITIRENLEFPITRRLRDMTQKEIDLAVRDVLDAVGLLLTVDQYPSELQVVKKSGQELQEHLSCTLKVCCMMNLQPV
ncbi:MAG TPA: hypothetical protein VKA92_04145 [Segetibacter sp.]|nr:hypothetical protein [Segetibacter sp.]